jgi:2'-5' RNA ligase
MPFAVTLQFDAATAPSIEAFWRALAAAGIDSDRADLGYAPHVTLAVYADDAPAAVLQDAVKHVSATWVSLPVTLAGLGIFPAPSPILWAAPVVTQALLLRHAALQAALPGLTPQAHYRPNAWLPHVTLSGTLADPGVALAVLLPLWRPVTGLLDRVDLVRFRPVDVLYSRPLPRDT